jgi:uncharacterized protein with WD repeat
MNHPAKLMQLFNISGMQLGSFPEPGVILMALSPAGSFLVTVTKPGKAADTGEPVKNLKVWDLGSLGSPVFTFSLRTVSKDTWPIVQWAGDDSFFVIVVPNTAMVYSRADGFSGELCFVGRFQSGATLFLTCTKDDFL